MLFGVPKENNYRVLKNIVRFRFPTPFWNKELPYPCIKSIPLIQRNLKNPRKIFLTTCRLHCSSCGFWSSGEKKM